MWIMTFNVLCTERIKHKMKKKGCKETFVFATRPLTHTTSIFSSSFSFFSFSFFLALAVMDKTAVETWQKKRET